MGGANWAGWWKQNASEGNKIVCTHHTVIIKRLLDRLFDRLIERLRRLFHLANALHEEKDKNVSYNNTTE